jgi:hypothetical protein
MKAKILVYAFPVLVLAAITQAQQPPKVTRLGFLIATSPSAEKSRLEAFLQGMRELG